MHRVCVVYVCVSCVLVCVRCATSPDGEVQEVLGSWCLQVVDGADPA